LVTETAAKVIGLYDITMFAYFGAFIVYAVHMFFARSKPVGLIANLVLWAAWIMHTVFLVQRSVFYFHQHKGFVLPATNMFEAISFFVWLIVLLYFGLEIVLKTRYFGVLVLLLPVAGLAYTARGMSPDARELMPALKSYWLVFHVTAMFISYAAFALAFSFAIMYILRSRGIASLERIDPKFNMKYLDEVSYKLIMFGFPILTLGIFLGAVWADSAWGRYWGWDPKETWALITWLIYLAYLHLRVQWHLVGYRSALLNVIGFAMVLVTFQGVNLLDKAFNLNSIHAYAEGDGKFFLIVLGLAILIPTLMYFLPKPKEDVTRDVDSVSESRLEQTGAESDPTAKEKA